MLPSPIAAARRNLDGLDGIAVTREFAWDPVARQWILTLDIEIESSQNSDVPRVTSWFLIVDQSYPLGLIKLYPALHGAIEVTFPHQDHNGAKDGVPFRRGGLCLEAPTNRGDEGEPFDALHRLMWHVRRGREWVRAAALGTLRASGDRFELPYWPNTIEDLTISFDEAVFDNARPNEMGWAELAMVNSRHLAVISARAAGGGSVGKTSFGKYVQDGARQLAVWLRCTGIPIVPPWGAPATWAELKRALRGMDIELDQAFELAARRHAHTMLIGFPIPAVVGGPHVEVWWQALRLPKLRRRGNLSRGERKRLKTKGVLASLDSGRIEWITMENVSRTRLGARGALAASIARASIAIIGAGALGSMISDGLVRGGCERLHVIDPETLCMGNLVRHCLEMRDLGRSKAEAVGERANRLMPYVTVSSLSTSLPSEANAARDVLAPHDLIVDCTGSDSTLRALAQVSFATPKLFVSTSVGRHARRLFYFCARGTVFPFRDFKRKLAPWLGPERLPSDQIWEGAGCWHPVSHARMDWLMIAAATSIRLLSEAAHPEPSRLLVFEHEESEDLRYLGFRKKDTP